MMCRAAGAGADPAGTPGADRLADTHLPIKKGNLLRCKLTSPCVACEIFGPTGLGYPTILTAGPLMMYCHDKAHEEMRRYLYRNVAMEYRKSFADSHKMPDLLPGWA